MPTARQKYRSSVIAKCGRSCMYCGAGPLQSKSLHVGKKDLRGDDEPANWLVSCLPCSQRRAGMSLTEYATMRLEQVETERSVLRVILTKAARDTTDDLSWG